MFTISIARLLSGLMVVSSALSMAQGGLFNDTLMMRDALRTRDGGYCVRAGEWPVTYFSRYDAAFDPLWANDIRLMAGNTAMDPYGMEAGPDGSVVVVSGGEIDVFGDFSPYTIHHHIAVARVNADGTILDAREHVLMTESFMEMDFITPYSYITRPISCSNTGDMFFTLQHQSMSNYLAAIMKVDADGGFAWCVRCPDDALIMSRILPDETGGCYVVLYNGSQTEHFSVVHLGADGSTVWSKNIERAGYSFLYPFHLHVTADDRLLVIGTSDNNLMRARLTLDGELEEFTLIATFPTPGQGWGISATGSALANDGSMTMLLSAAPPQNYRAVRTDPAGTVISAWTTPDDVEGTWTTKFYPGWVRGEDSVLTAVGDIWQEESTFGFSIGRPMIVTTPLDLSGFCDLVPVQFQQTALPLSQIGVTDGPMFEPVQYVETIDDELTMTPASQDQPEELCAFLALSAPEIEAPNAFGLYPNPVSSGGTVTLDVPNASEAHLIDAAGQVVLRVNLAKSGFKFHAQVTPGIYLLVVKDAEGNRTTSRLTVE